MTENRLSQIITTHTGIDTKVKDDEVFIKTCVSCGNSRWNLQANVNKNVINCWACPYKGTVNDLLNVIGYNGERLRVSGGKKKRRKKEQKHEPIQAKSAKYYTTAINYLETRNLSIRDIKLYDIMYRPMKRDDEWQNRVIFPLKDYFSQNTVVYQGRNIKNQEPKYKLSWKVPEDTYVGYRTNSNIHVVTEGVFDAVNIHKAGYNVSILLGLQNIKRWKMWAAALSLDLENKFVVLLDSGTDAHTKKLHNLISEVSDSCHSIYLEGNVDPGDLVPNQIRKLIEEEVNYCEDSEAPTAATLI